MYLRSLVTGNGVALFELGVQRGSFELGLGLAAEQAILFVFGNILWVVNL